MSAGLYALACAGVGALGAGWLPLTAYRLSVPAGEPSLSACHACGQRLPAGLAGWLGAPAECSACGRRLGPRHLAMAATAALACAVLSLAVGPGLELAAFLAMAVLGVLLAAIDLRCRRLPWYLVTPAIWIGALVLAIGGAATGDWAPVRLAVGGAAALGLAFYTIYLISRLVSGGALGFGDVRLAVLLGGFLGLLGWREVLWGGLLPWLLNGPVAVVLLARKRINRKELVPLGPAMLGGALLSAIIGSHF